MLVNETIVFVISSIPKFEFTGQWSCSDAPIGSLQVYGVYENRLCGVYWLMIIWFDRLQAITTGMCETITTSFHFNSMSNIASSIY